jgi:hypothetical protein
MEEMFNADQRAHMEALSKIPLEQLAWCGWYRVGECAKWHGGRCADPALTCANKCLPCTGHGKRRLDGEFTTCPDCGGDGFRKKGDQPRGINPDRDLFYFGCWNEPGHHLWTRHRRFASGPDACPESFSNGKHLDTGFCPKPGARSARNERYYSGPQTEGSAALHHLDGWTILSFWDRSVDKRGGCNSAFVVRGEHTFEDVVGLAKTWFPSVWARFKFEVRLWEEPKTKTKSQREIEALSARVAELEHGIRRHHDTLEDEPLEVDRALYKLVGHECCAERGRCAALTESTSARIADGETRKTHDR